MSHIFALFLLFLLLEAIPAFVNLFLMAHFDGLILFILTYYLSSFFNH